MARVYERLGFVRVGHAGLASPPGDPGARLDRLARHLQGDRDERHGRQGAAGFVDGEGEVDRAAVAAQAPRGRPRRRRPPIGSARASRVRTAPRRPGAAVPRILDRATAPGRCRLATRDRAPARRSARRRAITASVAGGSGTEVSLSAWTRARHLRIEQDLDLHPPALATQPPREMRGGVRLDRASVGSGRKRPWTARKRSISARRSASGSSSSTFIAKRAAPRRRPSARAGARRRAVRAVVAGHGSIRRTRGRSRRDQGAERLRGRPCRSAHSARSRTRRPRSRTPGASACSSRSPDSHRRDRRSGRAGRRPRRRARSRSGPLGRSATASADAQAISAPAPMDLLHLAPGRPAAADDRSSGSSRGGKASVKPATQRARSRTEVKTPPIEDSAPYGSIGSSIQASSRFRYPWASRAAGTSSRSKTGRRPSRAGARSRSRTTSLYSAPATAVMTRPRIPYPRLEYSNRVPGAQAKRQPAAQELRELVERAGPAGGHPTDRRSGARPTSSAGVRA